MPTPTLFRKLGLYVDEAFLDPSLCQRLRQNLQVSRSAAGRITVEGDKTAVDETIRRVDRVGLEGAPEEEVRKRLLDRMPALAEHFQVDLGGCQGPEFLRYRVGSFYKGHVDNGASHPVSAGRRVSAVVFLNRQSKEPQEQAFGGGSLVFYGLMKGEQFQKIGLPVDATEGLLVAFPSEVFHEVQPVTHGERMTVVNWFTAKDL